MGNKDFDVGLRGSGPAQGKFSAFAGTRARVLKGPAVYENYPIKKQLFRLIFYKMMISLTDARHFFSSDDSV